MSLKRVAAAIGRSRTSSGIEVQPVYGAADAPARVGRPGEFPYTRGIQPTMYRGRLWTMRQYAGMGDAEASNARYRFLLANGTAGLSVAFDLPTQLGYDSDSPLALGEVGRVGVAIDSIEDMERLFAGISLEEVSTSMTINATASIVLALYAASAKRGGAATQRLKGTIQNDILKEYIARGTYIFPVADAMRLVTDSIAWAAAEMPAWNTISISGYHMREAGATAAQELAFTLAGGLAYVQAALDSGLGVDAFAPRLSFFFNAHSDLFEEVAKFRAARRMWATLMRERFGANDPRSCQMRFHTQTAGSTLTSQQPENNVIRTTLQALAGVLGGTQSLHTNGFDEALGLPTETSARLALRTQQVIAYESGVTRTVDPLAGSYYVEHLTDELERLASEYLQTIAAFDPGRGQGNRGMLHAIEQGYPQREIQSAAYAHQRSVDAGETIVVGVNRFVAEDAGAEVPVQVFDPELEQPQVDSKVELQVEWQVERLRALRLRRPPAAWAAALRRVEEAARSGTNIMPALVDAVESLATVGEIAGTLRGVFGEYRESVVL